MIACDEIISVMDIVSTKMTNTIATNVTKDCHSKKVTYCYILHTVLLAIILLLIVNIICYCYSKHRSKKWKIIYFKKFVLKIVRAIISMT